MNAEQLNFITHTFPALIENAEPQIPAKWGKMNIQQMVEHVTQFFKLSTGKLALPYIQNPEHADKLKAFLYSNKEFRENTQAPEHIVPKEPLPVYYSTYQKAVEALKEEINLFKQQSTKEGVIGTHPVFGPLIFNEWVMLHYKHVLHHSKQFNLI